MMTALVPAPNASLAPGRERTRIMSWVLSDEWRRPPIRIEAARRSSTVKLAKLANTGGCSRTLVRSRLCLAHTLEVLPRSGFTR